MTYCITYILSCITKHSPQYKVLMLGRVLGGIATSLLFSAFESWLVAEHFKVNSFHLPLFLLGTIILHALVGHPPIDAGKWFEHSMGNLFVSRETFLLVGTFLTHKILEEKVKISFA